MGACSDRSQEQVSEECQGLGTGWVFKGQKGIFYSQRLEASWEQDVGQVYKRKGKKEVRPRGPENCRQSCPAVREGVALRSQLQP